MACGVLPAMDKQVCSFERWLAGHLAEITDPEHAQLIRRFATWEVLPRLRTRAEKKAITPAGRRHAGDQVKHATAFLRWLTDRGRDLTACRQADVDAWHAGHNEYSRNTLRAFLLWCTASKLTPRFRLPTPAIRHAAPLEQRERLNLLGYLLTSGDLPLRPRVAAIIVLLYAQPLSRVVRLTIDDVTQDGDQVLLRLGDPPSPLPAPVAGLVLTWMDNRDNMNTATNRHSRWLFPGRRAGQPMHSGTLAALVGNLGIPATAGRACAIRQHVTCPPRSSPRPSATTTSPQPNSPPNPEAPGAATPRRPLTVIIRPSPAANPRQLNRRAHQNQAPIPPCATPANRWTIAAPGGHMRTPWSCAPAGGPKAPTSPCAGCSCTPPPGPGAAKIARGRKLDRAREDLDRLTRGLGSRHNPDEAARPQPPGRHRQDPARRRLPDHRHRHRPQHRQADLAVGL